MEVEVGIKEGLLCLLVKNEGHGYQLKQDLESATGDTWQVNIGQVYTTLQRLERDGLATSHSPDADGRVTYSVTDDGRVVAKEWMAQPVDLAAAGRDEISLKLLMALVSGVEHPRRVIEVQRGSIMGLLQDYTALKSDNLNDDFAWLLYLDRLIFSAEAELRWLERVESRLDDLPAFSPRVGETESAESMEVTQ
ncbi:MAG: PadR family transcriptional regulator [Acidimicrobiia bacterium]|nr:PadR family transcriptional regulator [Acidimicrobiia bacterium]